MTPVEIVKKDLLARGLKPAALLVAGRPCGIRLKYMAGCRCSRCRRANSLYECQRLRARKNGDWNGIVSAARARRHLLKLSRLGIGRRAVSIASDVPESTIYEITSGKKKNIRARTQRKILVASAQDARDHATVPARTTWKLIRMMTTEGYTQRRLARELGYKKEALQFNRQRVLVRTAWRVEKLFERLMT